MGILANLGQVLPAANLGFDTVNTWEEQHYCIFTIIHVWNAKVL